MNNPSCPKKMNEIEKPQGSTQGRISVSLVLASVFQLAFPEESFLLPGGKS